MAGNTPDFSALVRRIAPVKEQNLPLSALVYGKSGTGKTAFASTWPKPMLLLDINEKGTDTIANIEDIDVISIEKWDEFEQMYWYLCSPKAKGKYKTIVIDQITGLQNLKMDALRIEANKGPSDVLSQREWGQASGAMQTWLLNYRDLVGKGMNIVFVAHEREDKTEDAVDDRLDPSIGPRVMPSVAATINGAVSLIGNTFIREQYKKVDEEKIRTVTYCMRIGAHQYYVTKVRRPKEFTPPDVISNPTHDKLLKLTRGEALPSKAVKRKIA